MAPGGWGTAEQKKFFELWMPEFLIKKGAHSLDSFWVKMKAAWYAEFPEETNLGLPVQEIDPDPNAARPRKLTPQESTLLDQAMARREKQLHNAFNNRYAKERGGAGRSARSMAAMLFKARPKRRRRHQVLEVYQMEHKEVVQEGLKNSEYDSLNEAAQCRDADGEWIDDEDDDAKTKRISDARSQRMKVKRRVVQELWDDEPEEVKERIREIAKREVVETAPDVESGEGETKERTPEEYQLSLDESMQVAEMFLHEFHRMTGWVGVLVVCFGDTPGKVDFENWHPHWKKGVTNPLFKFARQAIPRSVRASRAIVSADKDNDDEASDDAEAATPVNPKKASKKKVAAPSQTSEAAASLTSKTSASHSAPVAKSKPPRRPRTHTTASRSVSSAPATTTATTTTLATTTAASATPTAESATPTDLGVPNERDTTNDDPWAGSNTPSYQEYENIQQIETADAQFQQSDPILMANDSTAGNNTMLYSQFEVPHANFMADDVSRGSQETGGLLWGSSTNLALPDAYGSAMESGALGVPYSSAFGAYEMDSFDSGPAVDYRDDIFSTTGNGSSSLFREFFGYGHGSETPAQWGSHVDGNVGAFTVSSASIFGSGAPGPPSPLESPLHAPPTPTPLPPQATVGTPRSPAPVRPSPASVVGTPRSTAPVRPSSASVAGQRPIPATTPKQSSSTPRRSSPLAGPPLHPAAAAADVAAVTPQRTSSAPLVSSPLAQPPLQAGRPNTPPPPPSSLPPRLRPSPDRAHARMAPSPPVYPMSQPMANAPKMPSLKLTPGTMAKKMAGVRDARKAKVKKGGKVAAAQKEAVVGGVVGTAVDTVSGEGSGGVTGSAAGATTAGSASSGVADGVVAPALIFSSTNNNRQRIQLEDQQRRSKEKAAAEAKKERMRLHNPDGESELVIVPPTRPRRTIHAPQNKGPVMSLIDKKQAEEDAALLAALNKDKTVKNAKRKSDSSQENLAPAAKRAKSK
ncbi:hypothetical protein B0H11DRAFT_2237264 [Mycena galericulata]|nr:hypothetical protein B0H11DRAFT_2237264 [Mycena galericulata]